MRISSKRRSAAYDAIHDEIMDLRVELNKMGLNSKMDHLVAQVGNKIWKKQKAALNIPPEVI